MRVCGKLCCMTECVSSFAASVGYVPSSAGDAGYNAICIILSRQNGRLKHDQIVKKLLSAGVTLAAAALLMSGCKSTAEAPVTYQGTIIAQVGKHTQNFDIMPSAVARAAAKMVINNMEMSVASPSRIYLTIFFDNEKTEWVKLQVDYSLDKGEYSVKAVDSSAKRENGVGRRGDNSMAKVDGQNRLGNTESQLAAKEIIR